MRSLFSRDKLFLYPRWQTESAGAELVPRQVGAGQAVQPLLDQVLPHLLEVIIGHVLVTHDGHLVGGEVAHNQVLPQADVGPDVELPGLDLAAVLAARLPEPLEDRLLDGGPQLLHVHLAAVGDAGVRVEGRYQQTSTMISQGFFSLFPAHLFLLRLFRSNIFFLSYRNQHFPLFDDVFSNS